MSGLGGIFGGLGQALGYNYQAPQVTPAQTTTPSLSQALALQSGAASGRAPSAGQAQMTRGLNTAMRQAGSLAGSTRGNFGLANAARQAQGTQAGMAQQAVTDAATMRAQEQERAREAFGGLATSQAQMETNAQLQQNMENARLQEAQNRQNYQQSKDLMAGVGSAASTALSAAPMIFSDSRTKDVQPGGQGDAHAFLAALEPTSFDYRSQAHAGGAPQEGHLGVIAQDVERAPGGPSIVSEGPGGMKQMNIASLASALAAGAGALKKRQDEHEMRLAALERHLGGGV